MDILRDNDFYNIYRDKDPVLYEVLMDTLETMWLMREAARHEGEHIYRMEKIAIPYMKLKDIVWQIDMVLHIRRRYQGRPDTRIENLAWVVNQDYETVYRSIDIYHRQRLQTFEQAYDTIESNLESKVSGFYKADYR